ncbi:MAG: BrnT family toxin [Longispora sp.]|nr:BrnT family toxin [Longispora sp. (in: high G+C Gram-positive bacteria)]
MRTTLWYAGLVYGEILWTEESEAHTARHEVTPREIEDAIYTCPRWVDDGRDGTKLVFAVTSAGRHLFVVVTQAADGRDFIVTAREMTNSEKRTFREKGR